MAGYAAGPRRPSGISSPVCTAATTDGRTSARSAPITTTGRAHCSARVGPRCSTTALGDGRQPMTNGGRGLTDLQPYARRGGPYPLAADGWSNNQTDASDRTDPATARPPSSPHAALGFFDGVARQT